MKKRFTSLMTTLILSVFFSISASAYDVEVDGIYYNLIEEEKVATITNGRKKYSGDLIIPSSIRVNDTEYSVTSIGVSTFYDCNGLTSVTIPNSVTSIGSMAFYGCSGLKSITIPNSVTSIGELAFSFCDGLTSIIISNSVTNIERLVFQDCSGLSNIEIPNSVTSIGEAAFTRCSGLLSVNIPNSVTRIEGCAFAGCSGLSSVTIPNSVTIIEDHAFEGCNGIKNTIIVNDIFAFLPKDYAGHYSIPNEITRIIGSAFQGCSRLTSVTIPNSIDSIGDWVFKDCSSLSSITIPNSVTSIGNYAFSGCNSLKNIEIPNSVTCIGDNAFAYCSGLTSVTIPNSVNSIGFMAFESCLNIEVLHIDTSISPNIYHSPNLRELYFGDKVEVVYRYYDNMPLRKISLGKKVSQIRAEAFASSNIEEFTITGEEPPYLYPNVFGTQDLSNATLYVPESKTEYYQTTEPWSKFGKILTLSGDSPSEPEKCATPSISFSEGQLMFSCETEGAKCYYTLNNSDVKTGETLAESKIVNLSACYDITCYAKAEGYVNSDVATAKLYWLPSSGTLEGDNINNVSMRGIAIQSVGGFINISGLDINEKVNFYGIDGKSLATATAINGTVVFGINSESMILVKIGKESIKIKVNK